MDDSSWLGQTLLQYMSKSPTAFQIDREMGDLRNDILSSQPLLSYLRYDVELATEPLAALGFADAGANVARLRDMGDPTYREQLFAIGSASAAEKVLGQHFPMVFDTVFARQSGQPSSRTPDTET